MVKWFDYLDRWVDRWIVAFVGGLMDGWIERWMMDRYLYVQRKREGWMDGWMDEWQGRCRGGWTEWGTDRGRTGVYQLWEGLQGPAKWSPGKYPHGVHWRHRPAHLLPAPHQAAARALPSPLASLLWWLPQTRSTSGRSAPHRISLPGRCAPDPNGTGSPPDLWMRPGRVKEAGWGVDPKTQRLVGETREGKAGGRGVSWC